MASFDVRPRNCRTRFISRTRKGQTASYRDRSDWSSGSTRTPQIRRAGLNAASSGEVRERLRRCRLTLRSPGMAQLEYALRRNVVTAAQPRRPALPLRTEPGALLSPDLGSDLHSSAAGTSVVDATHPDGVSCLKQSSRSTENIMNASSSPLFTDTLKSIPGFFGIRLDTQPAYRIEDTDLRAQTSALEYDIAVQRAENEGLAIQTPGKAVSTSLFARISKYVRKDFDPAAKEQERTLEQLLVDLRTATNCDTQLRTRSVPLMALMASDLRDARRFPTEGALAARPMRAWLQRYNGIEFLQ